MTEKTRFIYKDNRMWFSFIDRQTGKHLNAIMCCNLMNELHEENVQLKKENQELHKLNQEYIDSLSDEEKETLSEMLNAVLGDDEE